MTWEIKKKNDYCTVIRKPGNGEPGVELAAGRPCLGEPPGSLSGLGQAEAVGSRANKHDTQKQAPGR